MAFSSSSTGAFSYLSLPKTRRFCSKTAQLSIIKLFRYRVLSSFSSAAAVAVVSSPSRTPRSWRSVSVDRFRLGSTVCRATAEYVFPDPIPAFADAETDKFRMHLVERLSKRNDIFGDAVKEIVGICTEILSNFLHTEYGGPGTLLVIPFIDMADTINERGLPGGPQAARAAVVWAQKHIDKDWNKWTGNSD